MMFYIICFTDVLFTNQQLTYFHSNITTTFTVKYFQRYNEKHRYTIQDYTILRSLQHRYLSL